MAQQSSSIGCPTNQHCQRSLTSLYHQILVCIQELTRCISVIHVAKGLHAIVAYQLLLLFAVVLNFLTILKSQKLKLLNFQQRFFYMQLYKFYTEYSLGRPEVEVTLEISILRIHVSPLPLKQIKHSGFKPYTLLPKRELIYLGGMYLSTPEVNFSWVSFSLGETGTLKKITSRYLHVQGIDGVEF